MAKIYFSCSMRGGFSEVDQDALREIPGIIESLGHILMSKHQISKEFLGEEGKLTPAKIYERNTEWLKNCDLFIAEISNPSLGVGAEIADAVKFGKPVLCMHKKGMDEKISAYIRGMKGTSDTSLFSVQTYETAEEIKENINKFINLV